MPFLSMVPSPIGGDAPNARTSDPIGSHITNARLRADRGMAKCVTQAVAYLHERNGGPVSDDDIWFYLEDLLGRRLQRNNLARTRGLLERDGWFIRVETSPRVRVIPNPDKQLP
jgi:hypothetical protein